MLEVIRIEQVKNNLKKKASLFGIIFLVITFIIALIGITLHAAILISIVSEENNPVLLSQLLSLTSSGIGLAAVIVTLFTISRMFSSISRAQTPLNSQLTKRLRLIGHFLIFVFLIGIASQIALPDVSTSLYFNNLNIDYYSNIPNNSLQIKFEYLFGAVFCYCLSYIFKYSIHLQKIADETI